MKIITTFLFLLLVTPYELLAAHGVSIDGSVKYPPNFNHFEYVSPDAPKGGELVVHSLGSFDKMNPFTLKGNAPDWLSGLVFEPLAVSSLDEPFARYGLVAKDIELAPDKLSVIFTIDENARFADGTKITPEDVKFSLETLKSKEAHPQYQIYYQDITGAEILDRNRIRFNFARQNREMHLIASGLPVLSKKFYSEHPFNGNDKSSAMLPPLGSGPYVVDKVISDKTIIYKRNPDYWAKGHPARKGQFNYDQITVKYFQDQTVSLEALKAGSFDVMSINVAKQWARDLGGKQFDSGKLVKKKFPHKNNAGMQGFVFNTRKELFKDPRVRKALGLALDFEKINKTLFFGQYKRAGSYFSNSRYAATGVPENDELALLEPFRKQLPKEVFTTPLEPPSTTPPSSARGNLRRAKKLLTEAGWKVTDGILQNAQGVPFSFEILLYSPFFERVMASYAGNLEKLGINVSYRRVDLALYIDRRKNFDFDMMVNVFGQSQSPGNEQRNYWHSTSVGHKGSANLAGINDPLVDHLVDTIIYASTQGELDNACRALDRVLWYGYYVVPNWYIPYHRIVYSSRLKQPDTLPVYYSVEQLVMTWWDSKAQ